MSVLPVLLAFALATGCATPPEGGGTTAVPALPTPPAFEEGAVVARVNGMPVGADRLKSAVERRPQADAATNLETRREVLDEVISDEVLFQEALRLGLYRDRRVRQQLVQALQKQEVFAKVSDQDFPVEQLQAYYDEHRDEFMVPEKVQVQRIFMRIDDRRPEAEAMAKAATLHAQLVKDPSRFAVLASENSEDAYRRRGGDLGYVERSGKPGIDPLIVETAFSLKEGGVSEPFIAGGGVNIVRLMARREGIERSFDHMRGTVLRRLKLMRYEELLATYIVDLKAKADVKIDEKEVDSLEIHRGAISHVPLGPGMTEGGGFEAPKDGEDDAEGEE